MLQFIKGKKCKKVSAKLKCLVYNGINGDFVTMRVTVKLLDKMLPISRVLVGAKNTDW